jgi:hypothetical protein
MCVICLQFQKDRDFADARRMIMAARREPNSIDEKHLEEIEQELEQAEIEVES